MKILRHKLGSIFLASMFKAILAISSPDLNPGLVNDSNYQWIDAFSFEIRAGTIGLGNDRAYVAATSFLNHLAWNDYLGYEGSQLFRSPIAPSVSIQIKAYPPGQSSQVQRRFLIQGLLQTVAYFKNVKLITNVEVTLKFHDRTVCLMGFKKAQEQQSDAGSSAVGNANALNETLKSVTGDYLAGSDLPPLPAIGRPPTSLPTSNNSATSDKSSTSIIYPETLNSTTSYLPDEWLATDITFHNEFPVRSQDFFLIIAATYACIAPYDRDTVALAKPVRAAHTPMILYIRFPDPARRRYEPLFRYQHVLRGLYSIVQQAFTGDRYFELDADLHLFNTRSIMAELGRLSMLRDQTYSES
ncbi:uncharacterized protein KY384_004075 [Bacidia gigantensis]|uniref:uncharacterized protein n=1 Tax=Bacidia gigantensis TaxID=2732470 RepID=UPI001D059122|nr:uncharacterized protein KY384_004075 [Bacidia gigantensis]KAG8530718.1 hypothetical protein KY384_004075 [Bacidia gigantensis]